MKLFKELHNLGKHIKSLNIHLFSINSEKSGGENLRDFRLISLVVSLYKLSIEVLNKNGNEQVDLEEKKILDEALIENKTIDSLMMNG